MSFYSAVALEASRRLDRELAIDRYQQDLHRQKLNAEMDELQRSRRQAIDREIELSRQEYERRLQAEKEVAVEHLDLQRRAAEDRRKAALEDLAIEKARLQKCEKELIASESECNRLDNDLLRLRDRSQLAYDSEKRLLEDLSARRKEVVLQLEQSKAREQVHLRTVEDLRLRLI